MTASLPMFPLNTVVFPGSTVPLRVFEERYRSLVQELLEAPRPDQRLFGTVGIREGYEVGDHGTQSLYRVGCRLQLTEVTSHQDGTFTIEAVARDRVRLLALRRGERFPIGEIDDLPDTDAPVPDSVRARATKAYAAYHDAAAGLVGEPTAEQLPQDPVWFSWALAGLAPLPMAERQSVLECDDPAARIELVTELLRAETRAVRAIPSLPATDVARTRWSPN